MKKLVIIGANDFQLPLILKAKKLGYETHVFAWEKGAVGKAYADYFYPISITEKEEILRLCREIKPCGVCSIASDLAVITVNFVANALSLPCNKPEFSLIQTNKYEMRKALSAAGVPCPGYILTGEALSDISPLRFPVIVKPTDRSGSRSVTKLETPEGLEAAVKRACDVSFEKKAIIEEFIEGNEYSMETITQNGVHRFLAITKKYTTGAPSFIETGHVEPSDLTDETAKRAKEVIFKALDALHIENSAAHSEFKVAADGSINIIEIGARMGGDCIGSDLVELSTGFDFVKAVIDVATGNTINSAPLLCRRAEIRFLFTEEDIEKMNAFVKANPERIHRLSEIEYENLGKTEDSSTRLGYFIFV